MPSLNYSFEYEGAELIVKPNGHIECNQGECWLSGNPGPTLWCDHLAKAAVHHADAAALWRSGQQSTNREAWWTLGEWKLHMPVFPTNNLWTEVHVVYEQASEVETRPSIAGGSIFIKPEDLLERQEIWWQHPMKIDFGTPDAFSMDFLTFITPGEGRQVIRSALIEKFIAEHDFTRTCSAAHHGFAAEKEWQARTRHDNINRHAEWWSVYTTGWCIRCHKSLASFDDAVPQDERRGVWSG